MKPLKTTLQIFISLSLLFFTLCDCDNPVVDPPPDDPPYDGPWEKVAVPDGIGNYALDFVGNNNGWVCGLRNIGHWNGQNWEIVKSFGNENELYILSGLHIVNNNDVWFSGTIESGDSPYTYNGVIIHYDGTDWETEVLDITTGVNTIWMFNDGTGWGGGDGLIYYDGFDWELSQSWSCRSLFFLSPTDGWACGLNSIYHWDGTEWTLALTDGDVWFRDIYFTAPDDGWAVSHASLYGIANHYHYDGTEWTKINDSLIKHKALDAIHFLRNDWGWAVGGSYFYDGDYWVEIDTGTVFGGNDIYCISENDVWISCGGAAGYDKYFLHFTGF